MPNCLKCEYELTGADGKCPECGFPFSMDDPSTYFEKKRKWTRRQKEEFFLALALPPILMFALIFFLFMIGIL